MKSHRKKRKIPYSAYHLVQVLCVLLALFDIAVTAISTYDIMEESVSNQIGLTESKIAEYMNNVWNLAGSIAENDELQNEEEPLEDKVKGLKSFVEVYGLYDIGIVDGKGRYASTNREETTDISGSAIFQELKEGQEKVLTDIYQARQGENIQIFTVWQPVFAQDTGEWDGAVEVSVYFDYMQNIIEGDSIDGKFYFCMYDSGFIAAAHANIKARGQSFEDNFMLNNWVSKSGEEIREAMENREKVSYWKLYRGKLQYVKSIPIRNSSWSLAIRTNVIECYRISMVALLSKILVYGVVIILFWWKGSREYKKRQSTFSWMTDMVDEIFIMQNEDTGELEYISSNAGRIMGYSPEEIRQQQGLIEGWLLENQVDVEEMKQSQDYQFQRKITNPHTGEQREFGIHIYVRTGEAGNYRIVVITDKTREIHQREMLETSLLQVKNASKAKSRFLSNMSHDIRTPMNAIVGMTTIARMNLDNPERLKDCIHKIELSAMHLKSLINDVLDMSKIESGRVILNEEAFNLKTLLQEAGAVMQVQAAAKKQEMTLDIASITHEMVVSDSLRIQQILTNVLGNAIKFTPEGGQIGLCVEETENRRGDRRFYEFYCMDNGIGMTRETQEKIFVPFERGETDQTGGIEGTGLGMAITKNIVNMMGGTIEIISFPGEGSTFIIRLPLQNEIIEELEAAEISGEDSGKPVQFQKGKVRILLVEDNELNMEIAQELLGITEAELEIAWNGKEGIEKFAENPENYFDIILSDVQMPEMNGHEMTRAIRQMNRGDARTIPVVAMTANAFSSDVLKARQAGMNGHIAKPIDLKDIYRILRKWIPDEKQIQEPGDGK